MHIIDTKYVRKFPSAIMSGSSSSRIVVPSRDANAERIQKYGLSNLLNVGDRMLPAAIGPATRRNTNGRTIVLRDQPKELHSWDVLWGREQFCGRDETEWVEDYVTRSCYRFPRRHVPPENVEVSLIENSSGDRFFATDVLDHQNTERWIVAMNMMLEINGSVWVLKPEEIDLPLAPTRRVNWRLLPPGTSWTELQPLLEVTVRNLRSDLHRAVATRKLHDIHRFNPDLVVVGEGGFNRYVAFCFKSRGFVVLESIEPNNATYILGNDWEQVSQMSKGEILAENLHLARFVHGRAWRAELESWFLKHAA